MVKSEKNSVEKKIGAAYNRDFAPAVVGYVVVIFAVTMLVDFDDAAWWKYIVALTPVIPALWGVRAVSRHLARIDEMQQQAQLHSMAAGFGVSMVVALTVGFLAMAGLDTNRWGPWVIYASGMAAWVVVGVRRNAPL